MALAREPEVVLYRAARELQSSHTIKFAEGTELTVPAERQRSNEPGPCGEPSRPVKILLVDDHALIREAMRGLIGHLKRDTCLLEAANCAQAMRLIEENADINLILLDLTLPDGEGFSVLTALRESCPGAAVVVLSASNDRRDILKSLEIGATGYIPKTTSYEVMLRALELVLSGGMYIPPEILGDDLTTRNDGNGLARLSPCELGLTERQTEVLALLGQGKSNKAIAGVLGLAEPTVKNHITAVLKALNASSRTEAVVKIERLRLKLPKQSAQ